MLESSPSFFERERVLVLCGGGGGKVVREKEKDTVK
jgi:hypothetical protein